MRKQTPNGVEKENDKTFQIIQLKLYFKKGNGEHYERNIEEDL